MSVPVDFFKPRQLATPSVAKATAVPVGMRFSHHTGFGYVHEPFTQAWQRNADHNWNRNSPALTAFSAVYACVTIISQDMACMPFQIESYSPREGAVVVRNSPYARVLRKPNFYQTAIQFNQFYTVCKLLRGNAYVFQELDLRGVPQSIHLLHPDRVVVCVEPISKQVFYQYTPNDQDMVDWTAFTNSKGTVMIPARFIIHDRINALWHPLIGTSPLYAAAASAATGGRILMNSENLFANMARPSGALSSEQHIEPEVAAQLKVQFEQNYGAGKLGRVAVLGDGLKWESFTMTSTDAQLIEQLKWTVEDVARCFRVPMYLLADTTRMTFKNSEQAQQAYFSQCLLFHVQSQKSAFETDWQLPDGQECRFDVDALFLMETEARYSMYDKAIKGAMLAPNEARRKERLKDAKGGEEPRIQMQYVTLSTPPEAPKPAEPASAPAPSTPEDDDSNKQLLAEILETVKKVAVAGAAARQLCNM